MKRKSVFGKVGDYFKESFVELKKVIWPSWDSVKANTLVVIVSVVIVAAVLGFFDIALARLINIIF